MSNKMQVALVDDDASLCRALGRLLRAAGISSAAYPSAEAFLAEAGQIESDWDCLVLDIQLGGMSGFELLRVLRDTGRNVPIIFLTAHDEPGIRDEAARAGCAAYLRKTDPGETVLKAVRGASTATSLQKGLVATVPS